MKEVGLEAREATAVGVGEKAEGGSRMVDGKKAVGGDGGMCSRGPGEAYNREAAGVDGRNFELVTEPDILVIAGTQFKQGSAIDSGVRDCV